MKNPGVRQWADQALMLLRGGNPVAALEVVDRAIARAPRAAELHDLRGQALSALGRHAEATDAAQRAVRLDPHNPNLRGNLGKALLADRQFEQAAQCFRRARALDAGDPWVHHNLGLAHAGLQQWPEAITALQAAVRLAPAQAQFHLSLGAAQSAGGDLAGAAISYAAVLRQHPDHETAINLLARALIDLNRLEDAEAMLRSALPHRKDVASAWNDLGNILICLGNFGEAATCIENALHRDPSHAAAHYNRAVIAFGTGRYAQAWPEWEWRWQRPGKTRPPVAGKPWQGEPLAGKRVLIHEEEGLGDIIQFCRFVPLLAEICSVALRVPAALERLIGTLAGAHSMFAPDAEPCDIHISILSLPGALGIDLATLPTAPYLHADPDLAAVWRSRLAPLPGPRIGFAWAGNPNYHADRHRSLPADMAARLVATPGVSWVSLQVGGADWTKLTRSQADLYQPPLGDLADTAALIATLDLVITVDSALAHLAGALGRPVWLLNRFNTDWRWLRGREDSPWYPSMRVFTQSKPGDWASVIEEVRVGLAPR